MRKLTKLPFFHGSCPARDNGGYPHAYPIDLYFDARDGMFRSRDSAGLSDLLARVYREGSLVDGSISNASGAVYVDGLLDYLEASVRGGRDSRLLEVGCGNGLMLAHLKRKGYRDLTGVEPGDHHFVDGLDGVTIVNDVFPHVGVEADFDLIYHFAVWEHAADPAGFLRSQLDSLAPNGRVVFGVPNCEPYLVDGDISMFLHEHYSYFTADSLERVVLRAGGVLEDVCVVQGMLVGRASRSSREAASRGPGIGADIEGAFWHAMDLAHTRLAGFLSGFASHNDVAVYVPGRALNALFTIGATDVRLVDDNPEMHGRYLPGLSSRVESFEQLCQSPPRAVLVYSKTFGHKIKSKCQEDRRLAGTQIVSLADVA